MDAIVVGYCGTGSSAVQDLLLEYSSFSVGKDKSYEHVIFYVPDGLFELEYKITCGCSLHTFDGAIRRFYSAMKRLNDNDFGWFGGFRNRFGNSFMMIVDEFVQSLTQYTIAGYWSDDLATKKTVKGTIKDIITASERGGERTIISKNDNKVYFSFLEQEEYFQYARKFVSSYCALWRNKYGTPNYVFDQLIQPQQLSKFTDYFDTNNIRVILVDRDPRDLFVLSKYVWPYHHNSNNKYYPDTAEQYVDFHRSLRKRVVSEGGSIKKLYFEDLVYKYDYAVEEIEEFLGLDSREHTHDRKFFIPEVSIKNTQNYLINSEWAFEVKDMERELAPYIYTFPYRVSVKLEETSDPS